MAKVQAAQELAAIKNAAIRHEERMAKYRAWVTPEAIAERKKRHEEEAAAALEQGMAMRRAAGLPDEDEPIPEVLPTYMKGQSPSTIRAMLRQEREQGILDKWMPLEPVPTPEPTKATKPLRWYQRIASWFKSEP